MSVSNNLKPIQALIIKSNQIMAPNQSHIVMSLAPYLNFLKISSTCCRQQMTNVGAIIRHQQ